MTEEYNKLINNLIFLITIAKFILKVSDHINFTINSFF